MNITYLSNFNSNTISCFSDNLLSDYILSKNEQDYFDTIFDNSTSYLTSLQLSAAIKAGSTLYTQPRLNSIYVRKDKSSTETDAEKLKEFLNSTLVGNGLVYFRELN